MAGPAVCDLLLGLDNRMKASPPHSDSFHPEFTETLLHSACSPLGPRGFRDEQTVFFVLEEFTLWPKGTK